MFCLDADFLIALIRNNRQAVSKLVELQNKGSFSTTPIIISELFYGAFKSKNQLELNKVERIASTIKLLSFDYAAARNAGELLAFFDSTGSKIGDYDTLNAAIALTNSEILVTRNIKHYSKVKGLKVETY